MAAKASVTQIEGVYMEHEAYMTEGHAQTGRAPRGLLLRCQEAPDIGVPSNDGAEERDLVNQLKAGDRQAFDEIFSRYVNQVYRQALRLTGNEMDAEDVVQEVFLAVYKNAGSFRGQSEFKTWLYRLTVNGALTKLRRNKRHREVPIEDYLPRFQKDGHHDVRPVVDWSHELDDPSKQQEIHELLKQALDQLGAQDRAVIVMSDLEGFADREIATILGLSRSAVKARLHRARLFLRGRLAIHLGYSAV